jgi:glyoxylase-like metal-dependent hydrolase (beta-lactamase superfamily II)
MAVEAVQQVTNAPVCLHPLDADHFDLSLDIALADGDRIPVGNSHLRVIHTPGHTPGQCCFDLGDGRVIVGDTLFVGGPGRTWSAQDFQTTMRTLETIVFRWPDKTRFYPGHGTPGQIGTERTAYENFVERGWPADLQGDVTWE